MVGHIVGFVHVWPFLPDGNRMTRRNKVIKHRLVTSKGGSLKNI